MIILLTILIILYALTSCKEKIQEKKGNEDNWRVYQQLEEKEEQKTVQRAGRVWMGAEVLCTVFSFFK